MILIFLEEYFNYFKKLLKCFKWYLIIIVNILLIILGNKKVDFVKEN